VYGYPLDEAAHVILSTLIDHCRGETDLTRIVMCLYDARALRVFDETLTQLNK
jgi:O-acetyl-ADP-ribose deacetylase (regulator of RNase III)